MEHILDNQMTNVGAADPDAVTVMAALENTEQKMLLEIFSVGLIKKQMFDKHFSYESRLLAC